MGPSDAIDARIDLHTHSIASDGELTGPEVAELAKRAGIAVWALTDHDTVAGLSAAQEAATRIGLRFVPGIELSAFLGGKEIHVLGHFFDPVHPSLRRFEDFLADHRRDRMRQIVAKLGTLGVRIRVEDVERWSGGKTIGRPHVARAIVEAGAAESVRDAFDRFLGEGKPAYVGRFRLEVPEAVKLVRGAGGTTTIAHPAVSGLDQRDIEALRAAGIDGIEVHHADHDPGARERLLRLAERVGLVPTAGSDFHGETISPGRHLGDVTMSEGDLKRLEARRP